MSKIFRSVTVQEATPVPTRNGAGQGTKAQRIDMDYNTLSEKEECIARNTLDQF